MQMQGKEKKNFFVKANNPVNETVPEEVQAQEAVQTTNVTDFDPNELYLYIMDNCSGNKDLINFAYFLYLNNLVVINDCDDDEHYEINIRTYFCDNAKDPSLFKSAGKSRLEQSYISELFTEEFYKSMWIDKNSFPELISNFCQHCNGCEKPLALCPYMLCAAIMKTAEKLYVSPTQIFKMLLGDEFREYRVKPQALNINIDPELTKNINSKSAYSAYLLLRYRFMRLRNYENGILSYEYLPLCRADKNQSVVNDIISFCKSSGGLQGKISLKNKATFLKEKRSECRRCVYEQCPDKLAAYFGWLAHHYKCNAADLAYDVACNNTHANLNLNENFQYDKYFSNIKESSLKENHKEEYCKIINYIVARAKNNNAPFLPFNIIVMSSDTEMAIDIIDNFNNAVWYFDYFRVGCDQTQTHCISMANTSFEDLIKIYETSPAGTAIRLSQFELMLDNDSFRADYYKLIKIMEDRKNEILTVVMGEKSSLNTFFNAFPEFRHKIFNRELEVLDMDNESVYDKLEQKLEENLTLTEEIRTKLSRYVDIAYPASNLKSMAFVNDTYEKILFNHYNYDVNAGTELLDSDLPYFTPPRSEKEIFSELDGMIGLSEVKTKLRDINNLIKFNMKTHKTGNSRVNLHMLFTGNAGTGKTTVARLTAEILHSIGFIQENKLVVCSAKDLVGEYLGQTAPKTAKKCEEAYNGVLFIDEAYQLNPYTSNSADVFKEECIAELIQQMENNRDKLVVIFAGYTKETKEFIEKANTGLKSRIGETIEFSDYSTEELMQIFEKIVNNSGMTIDGEAKEKTRIIFENARKDLSHFGNARFARNLFERSLVRHAALTSDLEESDPALFVLHADEIVQVC